MTTTPDQPFTPAQEAALAALVEGEDVARAAKRAGVTRQTVSLWRNHHDAFKAALAHRLAERDRARTAAAYSAVDKALWIAVSLEERERVEGLARAAGVSAQDYARRAFLRGLALESDKPTPDAVQMPAPDASGPDAPRPGPDADEEPRER